MTDLLSLKCLLSFCLGQQIEVDMVIATRADLCHLAPDPQRLSLGISKCLLVTVVPG